MTEITIDTILDEFRRDLRLEIQRITCTDEGYEGSDTNRHFLDKAPGLTMDEFTKMLKSHWGDSPSDRVEYIGTRVAYVTWGASPFTWKLELGGHEL
jgi:hypothetical protein